ncbi:MAG: alpha/beta hydrolase [Sandaracinaceae bacterium]|nr:alpha/beta hydrolase [Sandaracinaceae bacterium]
MSRAVVLDFRALEVGGPAVAPSLWAHDGSRLGVEALRALGGEQGLTFLIHGFNNSRSVGRASGLEFASLMRASSGSDRLGCVVVVLWPGDHRLGALTYSFEERDADRTAAELARTITQRIAPGPAASFVAHSLGCRVALETMRRLHGEGVASQEVVLMAGAVDADALARSSRYAGGVRAARRVATVASRHDRVLQFAFPAGNAIAGLLYGGYRQAALGWAGPTAARRPRPEPLPPTVLPLSVTNHGVGHGDYLPGRGPTGPKHESAAHFTAEVLRGLPTPRYPTPGKAGQPQP